MPTVPVTSSFARVIQHLQAEGRLVKSQTSRNAEPRWHLATAREWRNDPAMLVSPEMVRDLKTLQFLERATYRTHWPLREVYVLSDIGKAYRLPPEKFWVQEPAAAT